MTTDREHRVVFLVTIVALSLLALFANPYPFFKDSGELASSMANTGIAHPTGFPLQHVVGSLVSLFPFGPISFRLSLLSAFGASIAFFVTMLLSIGLGRKAMPMNSGVDREGRPADRSIPLLQYTVASGAGAALLLSDTVWFHSLNVEVYAPSLGLSALLILAALNTMTTGSRRWFNAGMLCGGLAFGMHVTCVMVFGISIVFVLISLLVRHGRKPESVLAEMFFPGLLFVALGGLAVLYLPLRALQEPVRNWGDPSSLPALLAHLSGRSIRTSFSREMLQLDWHHIRVFGGTYAEQMTHQMGSLMPLSLLGVAVLLKKRRLEAALLLLLLLADAAFSILLNPMGQVEKQTSTLSLLVLAIMAGIGMVAVATTLRKRPAVRSVGQAALVLVMLAVTLFSPAASLTPHARMSRVSSLAYATACRAFHDMQPEALLVSSQDDMSALGIYMQEVEHRRPDGIHLVKQMVCVPSFLDPVLRRAPENQLPETLRAATLQQCDSAQGRAGGPGEMVRAWAAILTQLEAHRFPISWELGEPAVDSLLAGRLSPGFPCFTADWTMTDERLATEVREFATEFNAFFDRISAQRMTADDISANAMADYARLLGAFVMRSARGRDGLFMLQTACSLFSGATRLVPGNCRALNNLSVCLGSIGKVDEAAAAAGLAAHSCPLYSTARVNLIRYLLLSRKEGTLTQAREELAKLAQSCDRSEFEPLLARLHGQLEAIGLAQEAALVGAFLEDAQFR